MSFVMAAVMLAAFAPHVGAATKLIEFTVTPAELTTGTTAVYATIKNAGNSNANSFEVDWLKSPYFTVNSASANGTTVYPSPPGLTGTAYSRVIFTQQLPTKTSVTITLNVTVTGVNECAPTSASLNWVAYAWTGAPGPVSQSFTITPPGPRTTTLPASASCTIAFVDQPKDAFIGSIITSAPFDSTGAPVSVQLLQNGAPAPTTTVTVSSAACAISATATTNPDGIATFPTLTSNALATQAACQLTASATGYGSSAPSASFKVVASDGILGCGDPTEEALGAAGALASGMRLQNTDGGCGAQIPYVLVWRDLGDGQQELQFVKDDLGQSVAMTFAITWSDEPVPAPVLENPPNPLPPNYGVLGSIPLSRQQFDASGSVDLDLCVGTPSYTAGELTGLSPIGLPGDQFPDLSTALEEVQYGCVYDRHITFPAPPPDSVPVLGLKELIYLQGDWGASRVQ
jgi:hypothetical protein